MDANFSQISDMGRAGRAPDPQIPACSDRLYDEDQTGLRRSLLAQAHVLSFLSATYFLLAVPGPTNALLATSGAGIGIARSLHLLVAELCDYLLGIATVRLALGPIVGDIPIAALVLRVAVSVYILCLAFMLWRVNTRELSDGATATFGQVLLATLLDTKAAGFRFSAAAA